MTRLLRLQRERMQQDRAGGAPQAIGAARAAENDDSSMDLEKQPSQQQPLWASSGASDATQRLTAAQLLPMPPPPHPVPPPPPQQAPRREEPDSTAIVVSQSGATGGAKAASALDRAGSFFVLLNIQFRMHPALALFPSLRFYEGRILTSLPRPLFDPSASSPFRAEPRRRGRNMDNRGVVVLRTARKGGRRQGVGKHHPNSGPPTPPPPSLLALRVAEMGSMEAIKQPNPGCMIPRTALAGCCCCRRPRVRRARTRRAPGSRRAAIRLVFSEKGSGCG